MNRRTEENRAGNPPSVRTQKRPSYRQRITGVVTAVSLGLASLPVTPAAAQDAQMQCADRGGRMVDGRCDTSSPPAFDLFGWAVIGALVIGAVIASGESDRSRSHERSDRR